MIDHTNYLHTYLIRYTLYTFNFNMSSAITVDYTRFDTFPARFPENWPILKNGINSTWRESLSQSLVDKIDSYAPLGQRRWQFLHEEWKLEDMKDNYFDTDCIEISNEAFCVWLVHDIPVYDSNKTIDTKIMDHFNDVAANGDSQSFKKPLENSWLTEAKKLLAQPNQTIYNVYNILWNHSDTEKKIDFRMDLESDDWY